MDSRETLLLLHGTIVLLVGLLAGAPYHYASEKSLEATAQAWRVAHSGLTMGGILLIAVAAALGQLTLGARAESLVIYSLIVSGYGFCISLPYGAWTGNVSKSSWIVFTGNMIGAGASLVATIALLYAIVAMTLS